ncbi:WD40-repeat-containing domain protein [Phyllosticta capitalensis]
MAKRKRETVADTPKTTAAADAPSEPVTLQIVTGSYERVLHGLIATVEPKLAANSQAQDKPASSVKFADTFLFNAHASAIRCLALSPASDGSDPHSQKVILASGSTDERINLYNLSTAPPPKNAQPSIPSLHGTAITQNPKNRELGALTHHSATITCLKFPSRSKLFSGADDNTVAMSRTRDWTMLSSIKAPIPKAQGRPSGDTAAPGEVPTGINDFAVHPSQKVLISVSKGEKCMRLWNLMTGKKASVLAFDRDLLQNVGEGRWSSGEGRKLEWEPEGKEWVVAFERGFVIYDLDSRPIAQTLPRPMTKLHQLHYVPNLPSTAGSVLAASTEDGRILFYSSASTVTPAASSDAVKKGREVAVPSCRLLAQLGGRAAGLTSRIKDFEILPVAEGADRYFIITGSSDGAVKVWRLNGEDLVAALEQPEEANDAKKEKLSNVSNTLAAKQVGELLGTHEGGNRITCLKAFVMTGAPEEAADATDGAKEEDVSSSDDSDSD